ncbi:Asp-tRNA(Asn)/Glu-tRNA(Gln) amidotransferase A subunit family amidase [Curtobacterium sp. PhB142]|uniref:AtzH-like domain-containing protein n=1 Tax=unclassified Curtobacterium TaxID=257496 RepID=UPI001045036F|nr:MULTISPECIES: AtzH-like domain-containing protein [unclassified Curtobacterium]TCL80266.1 Asp-tRNA(Asn)/Glu-tRNA(Gln) amidotransferase A subunit family amidase [Curtobacterium sp. PhB142]TCL99673.1 Asp-tRNA(Asn)/Glu-tRNA(Gln) amidotransferase A subunit family amidase [Curtobacterium sp. PhB134]
MSTHVTSTHETSTAAPDGLLDALDAYEAALAANDLDALDAAFVDAPGTMRGDDRGLLVGHDAISAFRGARGGVQARSLTRVEVRPLAEGLALVVSVSEFAAGGQGLQTQLWRRDSDSNSNSNSDHDDAGPRWRIEAAHVTGRPKAFDTTVWRAVGDPLVAPTASGPLDGLTVAVKDLYAVPGQPVGAGNPTSLRESPVQTTPAAAVAALLDAGAAIRGIARTDEFAYNLTGRNEHHGTPPNGAVPTRLPGGSSSGSASAVRLGTAEIGIGTDTAGSVRVPASYQGLWGLRTTHGAVSRDGLLPLAPSFDTVGWLTRSADVLLAALDATVPSDPDAPAESELLVPAELLDLVEPAVAQAFTAFVAGQGHPIGTVQLADLGIPPLDDLRELLRLVQAAEAVAAHGAWIDAHPGALSTVVGDRFAAARANDPAATADAVARLDGVRATIRTALADRTLLFPTVPGPAPLIAADTTALERTRTATTAMTSLASVGGTPAVSAPALTVDGAPVGVCLVGEPGTDRALVIRAGRMLQH